MISKYWPLTLFFLVFGSILYVGWWNHEENPNTEVLQYKYRVKNCKLAFLGVMLVFLSHRIFAPNIERLFTPFHRIWRVNANFVNFYLYLLVFIYFMNEYDARAMWKFVDEDLGQKITKEYHTYDDDCTITWFNILDNMDHYFLVHFINWFVAAIILRDAYLLHFWSVLDEILELSAQYKLPHFRECWWDHVFHDVLITNTPGIILGLKFVEIVGLQQYDWLGRRGKKRISEWEVFNCHFRFRAIFEALFIISVNFLTGFFMINALWIPPKSVPTVSRLFFWFLIGNIVFKEGYELVLNRKTWVKNDIAVDPTYRWVTYGILVLEIAISFKFTRDTGNLLDDPMPDVVFYSWFIVFALIGWYYVHLRWIRKTDDSFLKETPSKRKGRKSAKKNQ